MSKQTPVEWLFNKMITEKHTIFEWNDIFKRAKQMESEQSKLKKQEKKETSLQYFHRRTRNNIINLDYQINSLEHAIKLYEEEIEKAYNKGWWEGAKNSASYSAMLTEFHFTHPELNDLKK